jgi:short subunit dehydrogenase-like uncharacterized protein
MTNSTWMLYGASGFTGRMIAEEAIRRGHHPILAGRSAERIRPLAQALHLPWRADDLSSPAALQEALQGVDAVLLAASPFQQTAPALVQACLETGTSYADIANEIPHFRLLQQHDRAARERGIVLVPGVGFGVVATNCLARSVAEQLPDATELHCANHIAAARSSAGAAATGFEIIRGGGYVIRQGQYRRYRLGRGARPVRFADAERVASPIPLGDLAAAQMATAIPNITMYSTALPTGPAGLALPLIRRLLAIPAFRQRMSRPSSKQPKEAAEQTPPHSQAWAWGRNAAGQEVTLWLSTGDGYAFTAASSVLAMEGILDGSVVGVLPPAASFGADFALTVPHTQRFTSLEEMSQATVSLSNGAQA